jgi:hypothetical protein
LKDKKRNPAFYGREDVLYQIQAHFSSPAENFGPKTFAICGLGGMGKSEVAAEFVYRHREEYDAIFWLQADQPVALYEQFSDMAVQLGLTTGIYTDKAVRNNLVKAWLAWPMKRRGLPGTVGPDLARWLIVFDNFEDSGFLDDCWPQIGHGVVLITSRDPTLGHFPYLGSAGFVSIDLPPFTATEGAELLMRLTHSESRFSKRAYSAVYRVGGFPLAIVQMAALANYLYHDFEDVQEVYYEGSLDGSAFERDSQVPNDIQKLAPVFALEELSRDSAALLNVLSLLDGDSVSETLFTSGTSSIGLDHFPLEQRHYLQTRSNLIRRSLVIHEKQDRTLRIHRLVQDIVRTKMSADRWEKVFGAAVHLVSALWPFAKLVECYSVVRWENCEQIMPHICSMHRVYDKSVARHADFEGREAFARLLVDAAGYVINSTRSRLIANGVTDTC